MLGNLQTANDQMGPMHRYRRDTALVQGERKETLRRCGF